MELVGMEWVGMEWVGMELVRIGSGRIPFYRGDKNEELKMVII